MGLMSLHIHNSRISDVVSLVPVVKLSCENSFQ